MGVPEVPQVFDFVNDPRRARAFAEKVSGMLNWLVTSDQIIRTGNNPLEYTINAGGGDHPTLAAVVTADVTNASTGLANISDLAVPVIAGNSYAGEMYLRVQNTQAAEGVKVDMAGGGATMIAFWAGARVWSNSGTTTDGTLIAPGFSSAMDFSTITGDTIVAVTFSFTAATSGSFIPRWAEDSHSSGAVTVKIGSNIRLVKITSIPAPPGGQLDFSDPNNSAYLMIILTGYP